MKALKFSPLTSPHLHRSLHSSHFLAPLTSMSADFLGSMFMTRKPILMPSGLAMATCAHSSRTEAPLQTDPKIDDHAFNGFMKFCRPNFSDLVSCAPISETKSKTFHTLTHTVPDESGVDPDEKGDDLWLRMKEEARSDVDQEPILLNYYYTSMLCHDSMESALANCLAMKLSNSNLPTGSLYDLFMGVLTEDQDIMRGVADDLRAVKERDPACISYVHCFLNFKGFLACQSHRIAHNLWSKDRKVLAVLIQNRVSEVFAVDIHPGAKIGRGILLDHATGVVVGETAVIGDNVSILHNVTLGGTGKVSGDRHPKIGNGVLIGAGTCVLGNVRIEDGAKVGAGSVVLKQVPARTTAVGNPAKLIGGKENPVKLDKIPSLTMDHTSHISEWSDYVI